MLKKIKNDIDNARKMGDKNTSNVLITLYSEASMVGKNNGNRVSTDDEVVSVVKKFIKNLEEVIKLSGGDVSKSKKEIEILSNYLPKQLSYDDLENIIQDIIDDKNIGNIKAMGLIMKELKESYSGKYDGKIASEIIKDLLS